MTPDTDRPFTDSRTLRAAKRLLAYQAAAKASLPSPSRAETVATILLLLVFLGGIVAPTGLIIWQSIHPTTVIAEGAAGRFEGASSSAGGFFGPTLTTVQTSTGTVAVRGTFSALRGAALVVQSDNKHDRLRLCTTGTRIVCARVDGDWPGTLTPTPQARHAINFVRHGLSSQRVTDWLGLGMLAMFLAFAIRVATAGSQHQGDGDDEAT
jgi:hypothetical protein